MFYLQTPKQPSEDAIIVSNVSKHFRIPHEKKTKLFEHITGALKGTTSTYEEFWAVKDVSFTVKKGETLGIIGENGSGKSTLLKIIAGVLTPDSGSVKVNGKVAPFLELGVGFNPELTAEDNVRLYGAIMGMSKRQMEAKFEEIFEFAELERFRNMKLKNFSSGMYARLAFATAAATDPDILLIDEVLSVGDAGFQRKCKIKMDEFISNNKTIILVSHASQSITDMCKTALLLSKGSMEKMGFSKDVMDHYNTKVRAIEEKKLEERFGDKSKEDGHISSVARITDVKMYDENGNETKKFLTNKKFTAKIKYFSNKKINDPIFGFAIHRNDGLLIIGPNTRAHKVSIPAIDGGGIIEYTIDNLPLLKGLYVVSAGIFNFVDGNYIALDYHDKKYYFEVFDNSIEEYGLIYTRSEWKTT
ncbi:MAG: ABC transporter ATP-binding protein [Candidatus Methanoperedens sp.]|nr:ABC transporter ATP-binding protein [Candidatus Methanoperedens sp. BLZ2]MBZ0174883.1 ABC transporter ATP-binding protein [Candidatus Methanoperedens nitroreducens]MCX9078824.1 ABC transporter ATP-binding protein [Candidatus Methanoperedens sp.]